MVSLKPSHYLLRSFEVYDDPVSPTVAITVAEGRLTSTVPVSWSGTDAGSGLVGYDLCHLSGYTGPRVLRLHS